MVTRVMTDHKAEPYPARVRVVERSLPRGVERRVVRQHGRSSGSFSGVGRGGGAREPRGPRHDLLLGDY